MSQPPYQVVLEAISEVRANQREMSGILNGSDGRLDNIEAGLFRIASQLDEMNTRIRSLQQTTGEIRELLNRWLNR